MVTWLVHTGRKDLIEKQEFTKGDSEIIYSLGWRTGTWEVTTSDENEPDFESDEDIFNEYVLEIREFLKNRNDIIN